MKRTKLILLFSIIVIIGFSLVTLWINFQGKKVAEEKEKLPTVSTGGADMRLEKIHFVEDKQGQKTWELEATSVQQYQNNNLMVLEKVKVTVYAKEGRTFTISGNEAKFYQDSKNMALVGDVVLTSSDGYRLKTHTLSYDNSEKKVTTSDPVEIDGEQFRLVGTGMVVDFEGKTFKVMNRVKAQWKGGVKG